MDKILCDSHKLYNVSGDIDPDNPVELSIDKKYAHLFESCRRGIVIPIQQECIEINNKALSSQLLHSSSRNYQVSQSGKSYFYSAPNEKCQISKDLFIIKSDVVEVIGKFNNFYNVIYKKKNGDDVTGWIYKDNLKLPVGKKDSYTSDDYNGDPLISKKEFVEGVNTSCIIGNLYNRSSEKAGEDNKRCVLSKISYPYDRFLNLGDVYPISKLNQGEKILINQSGNFNTFIKITKKLIKEGSYNLELTLFTENNGKLIDSLIIYKEKNDVEAFVAKQQYYFISSSLTVSILQVSSIEEGTLLDYWKNYKINGMGKIILLDSISCDYSVNPKGVCHNK